MKNYKLILLCLLTIIVSSCDLEEDNPNLASENAFTTLADARSTLDGVYNATVSHDYFRVHYFYLVNLTSGFAVTKKGGARNTGQENATACSLKPTSAQQANIATWAASYKIIARANNIINSTTPTDSPTTQDEIGLNDVIGQAYFLRAYVYLNLVRLWGDVPLRLENISAETVHLAKSSQKEVYTQIISDAEKAASLMNGSGGDAYPKQYAANMLLSKAYMTLATAPSSLQESGLNYWQLAYNEAKKVYGNYSLITDYAALFSDVGNTSESIFEIQSSVGASLDFVRAFTPSNFSKIQSFGRLLVNAEVYDRHADTYPTDPRIAASYIWNYTNQKNNRPALSYPDPKKADRSKLKKINQFLQGFPYFTKFGTKDPNNTSLEGAQNYIAYRYADLLLMLAEISNELGNGEEMGYVTEVLDRVGLTPSAEYSGGQDAFREAIMKEYQFELLLEGNDWYNNRRRGYTWFYDHVIEPHNNYSGFNPIIDVTFAEDEATVMFIPTPISEINGNEEVDD